MSVTEFRRRYGISAARWRALADSGNLPIIRSGPNSTGRRSEITDEDADAWARRQPEKFQAFVLGGGADG